MDREVECLCCKKCPRTAEKLNDNINLFGNNEAFPCIIEHQGFQSICLDPLVLQVAWLSYKQHYDNVYDGPTIKSTDMLPTDSMYVGHMVMLVNKYELS